MVDNLEAYRDAVDSRVSQITDEIISYITTNGSQPGDKLLSESQISENLNLSKTSVRECVSMLNNIGLIHSVQGKGLILNEVTVDTFFRQFHHPAMNLFLKLSPEEVKNIKDLRVLIETYAVEHYLESDEDDPLEEMEGLLQQMKGLCQSDDCVGYMEIDLLFHKNIVSLARNNFLSNIYSVIRIPILREVEVAFSKGNLNTIQMYHEKIHEELKQKNRNVINLMQKHLEYLIRPKTALKHHPPLK
ncbi:FadR/GntR family transcriptional regulator [Sediminispirochaeta smaragdinae]|uniref:GntR domain protein n=1 Tax=Sediminispirochaeta smaragdinae (strain DSM 11293 / JCM 15392 / SEBR 4228) TaxID=573413 RepID=E1RB51_SEDSS|nr:FCD domain-containing protein [Sediminispirochaeta smaragdinae]ADK79581.1 GntR domain protein [Sediminispirochaeta smaragdinae DSM 11293]